VARYIWILIFLTRVCRYRYAYIIIGIEVARLVDCTHDSLRTYYSRTNNAATSFVLLSTVLSTDSTSSSLPVVERADRNILPEAQNRTYDTPGPLPSDALLGTALGDELLFCQTASHIATHGWPDLLQATSEQSPDVVADQSPVIATDQSGNVTAD
jgi:hypothetical protein